MTDTEWRAERQPGFPDLWGVIQDRDNITSVVVANLTEQEAKLIAAAPDLLAALKFLAEDSDPAGKIARAAIKKVTS